MASYSPVRRTVYLLCLFLYFEIFIVPVHIYVSLVSDNLVYLSSRDTQCFACLSSKFTVNRLAELEEQKPPV